MEQCGIIVARQMDALGDREDGYLAECILKRNHLEPHVFKTPEGKFFAWEDDWKCGCCTFDEDSRCYYFLEIKEEDIPNLSKTRQT